jgi:hypothetical protein
MTSNIFLKCLADLLEKGGREKRDNKEWRRERKIIKGNKGR